MKPTNRKRKLASRITHWENNKAIQESNREHPGSFTKPGSQKK